VDYLSNANQNFHYSSNLIAVQTNQHHKLEQLRPLTIRLVARKHIVPVSSWFRPWRNILKIAKIFTFSCIAIEWSVT